jgi:hypothetical protein
MAIIRGKKLAKLVIQGNVSICRERETDGKMTGLIWKDV